MSDYDELVKRLRDAAKMSEALAVLLPNSEGNETAKLYREAADAIEALLKMPTPIMPLFPICNCMEKIERTDCDHYDEEQDMGAHIPYCKLYKRSGYCPCLGCEKYERKVSLLQELYKEGDDGGET